MYGCELFILKFVVGDGEWSEEKGRFLSLWFKDEREVIVENFRCDIIRSGMNLRGVIIVSKMI